MEVSDDREPGVSLVLRGQGDRAGEGVEPLVSRETGRERRGPEAAVGGRGGGRRG